MALDREMLLNWPFEDIEHRFTTRDTILYALGLGAGINPMDLDDLRYVYEEGLLALPTLPVVLGYPGFWLKDAKTGVNWRQVLHGEQALRLHAPLPTSGTIIGRTRVTNLIDKGEGKGALLYSERQVIEKSSQTVLATLESTTFLRADGGFGGPSGPAPVPHALPERAPDASLDLMTMPGIALIYRLSGDYNPLHADPRVAHSAGFERPILHGLCTYGIAGRALVRLVCADDPARLLCLKTRFSAPVYPGETIRTHVWRDGLRVSFRCISVERNLVVLNNGFAEIAP